MNDTTDRDSAKPLEPEYDQEAINDYREEHRGYCDDAHQMARKQDDLRAGEADYCHLCGGSGQIGTDLYHDVVMLGFSDWELVVVHSYDCMAHIEAEREAARGVTFRKVLGQLCDLMASKTHLMCDHCTKMVRYPEECTVHIVMHDDDDLDWYVQCDTECEEPQVSRGAF